MVACVWAAGGFHAVAQQAGRRSKRQGRGHWADANVAADAIKLFIMDSGTVPAGEQSKLSRRIQYITTSFMQHRSKHLGKLGVACVNQSGASILLPLGQRAYVMLPVGESGRPQSRRVAWSLGVTCVQGTSPRGRSCGRQDGMICAMRSRQAH